MRFLSWCVVVLLVVFPCKGEEAPDGDTRWPQHNEQPSQVAQDESAAVADTSRCILLLDSSDEQVLNQVLRELHGLTLDEALAERLVAFTSHAARGVRSPAMSALFADTHPELVTKQVQAARNVITAAEAAPDASDIWWPSNATYLESEYLEVMERLAGLPRIPQADTALIDLTRETSGPLKYCAVLARARRGEISVRHHVRAILSDPEADRFRAWAAVALAAIGTEEDLAILKHVARTDPFQRERGGCIEIPAPGLFRRSLPRSLGGGRGISRTDLFYPVRDAARGAVRDLQQRLDE